MHRASTSPTPLDTSLIESLADPDAFSHPVSDVELIETHISWLLLAGDYAYKIKKPLKFDFLDFSDLEKRRFYCEEELRLNKPSAPDIYLDVIPITKVGSRVRIGGEGPAIEYAVRMRRFDQELRLDAQLERGKLSVEDMKELAANIAARHDAAPLVVQAQRDRVLRLTAEFMRDNFAALEGAVETAVLESLREWTESELAKNTGLIGERFNEGFVRDCHGDLHLGNLVRLPDGITSFDCIEFNTDLRHIDVLADIAFLVMDLASRKRHDLAAHFLNRYLEVTGDYGGMSLLNLFFVYRCLVRAKVAVIRSRERESEQERKSDLDEATFYCDLASHQAAHRMPALVIMHGLSGSGKTWVSGQLMAALPAIRVRSDIERKRLFGIGEFASSESGVGEGIYTEEAGSKVYARLFDLTRSVLCSGHSVILDAAFLRESERKEAMSIAEDCDCTAVMVDVTAPVEMMRDRLVKRAKQKSDPSEAGLAVLEHQLVTNEVLTTEEKRSTVSYTNDDSVDVEKLVNQIGCRGRTT